MTGSTPHKPVTHVRVHDVPLGSGFYASLYHGVDWNDLEFLYTQDLTEVLPSAEELRIVYGAHVEIEWHTLGGEPNPRS